MATLYTAIITLLQFVFKLNIKTDTFFGGMIFFCLADFATITYFILNRF